MTTADHPTQTMMSVWFLPKDHKQRKRTGTHCTEDSASFKHHNATKDETAFLSFKFTFLSDSQNPHDGGMIILRNNGNHVQNYIISKPRSP